MGFKWKDYHSALILSLMRDRPSIWDKRVMEYRNKTVKDAAMDEIIREINIPGLTMRELKMKIKSIRTRYSAELKRVIQRSNGGPEYVPRLFWFKLADSFLRAVCVPRISNSNQVFMPEYRDDEDEDDELEDEYSNNHNNNSYNDDYTNYDYEDEGDPGGDDIGLNSDESDVVELEKRRIKMEDFIDPISVLQLQTRESPPSPPVSQSPQLITNHHHSQNRHHNLQNHNHNDSIQTRSNLHLKKHQNNNSITNNNNNNNNNSQIHLKKLRKRSHRSLSTSSGEPNTTTNVSETSQSHSYYENSMQQQPNCKVSSKIRSSHNNNLSSTTNNESSIESNNTSVIVNNNQNQNHHQNHLNSKESENENSISSLTSAVSKSNNNQPNNSQNSQLSQQQSQQQPQQPKQTESEFSYFCKSILVQLENMPLDRAILCQEKLQRVMTEERLYQYNNKITSNNNNNNSHQSQNSVGSLSITGTGHSTDY